ncbi:MAG TPA: regulatory protein RecX [Terracidiphilus sp.]|nr:regulatory protein RecX [Terracidiphilus sp.]
MPYAGKPRKPRTFLDEAALYNYAVKALGRHMRTVAELRRLMQSRAEPGATGEAALGAVILRLKEHGYLDDRAYAETYACLRQENEKLGARRIRQDLQQKGIRRDLIEETVQARYGETDEEKLAREYLSRKRIPKPESPKDTARVMRRLVAAGFSTGTIYKVLRRWDVPEEELAALDNLETEPREE